ncbi:MAG: hypothetical protein ACRDZP_05625, partial [Acidimicrobiales bacterium]
MSSIGLTVVLAYGDSRALLIAFLVKPAARPIRRAAIGTASGTLPSHLLGRRESHEGAGVWP